MAMNINEIDDFSDEILDGTEKFEEVPDVDQDMYSEDNFYEEDYQQEEDSTYEEQPQEDTTILLDDFLKIKGINPRSIKFETEDGIEEKDFNDLDREEQLQILSSNEFDDDYGLTDSEIEIINTMRKNNWSISDYNNYVAKEAIKNYTDYNQEPQYSVDDFSDDELYLIDLKSRIPDISEEEAMIELDNAKSNQSLYDRRVQNLRKEYKEREDTIKEQAEDDAKRVAEQQMLEFSNSILNTIENNSTIDLGDSSLEMSDEDKNILANFLLDKDQAGVRYIARALNDPNSLVQMAWYLINGKKAFSTIQDYYKRQISEVAKRNYNKGYEDAKNGKTTQKSIVKRSRNNTPKNRELTIDDID